MVDVRDILAVDCPPASAGELDDDFPLVAANNFTFEALADRRFDSGRRAATANRGRKERQRPRQGSHGIDVHAEPIPLSLRAGQL